ncbi:hypothetical protein SSTG_06172, partial [Streptomyces sp. e14]
DDTDAPPSTDDARPHGEGDARRQGAAEVPERSGPAPRRGAAAARRTDAERQEAGR